MENANKLKIAILQIDLLWEDISGNLQRIHSFLNQLPKETDIAVLPEMFSTGFSMNPEKFALESGVLGLAAMKNWSREFGFVVCGSIMVAENEKFFNRFYWVEPNGNFHSYDKKHLFRMGEENKHYAMGSNHTRIEYKGWKIAPFICYDLRFPVWMRNPINNPYDLIILVANWPEPRAKAWKSLSIARAIENQTYLVAVNRIGMDGYGMNYIGESMVLDPLGENVTLVSAINEKVSLVEIDLEKLQKIRSNFPVSLDADKFEFID